MKDKQMITMIATFFSLLTLGLLGPNLGFAHCDGMDGPVVKAAQKALETKDANLVLIWGAKER